MTLLSEFPKVAARWHPTKNGKLTPEDVTTGRDTPVWWTCPVTGEPYSRHIHDQIRYPDSPYVTNKKVIIGYNDLATTHPELVPLWHPTKNGTMTPQNVTSGSGKNAIWVCPDSGAEYSRRVCKQSAVGPRSPYMTGTRVLTGYNDLNTTHPQDAALWHPTMNGNLTPQDVTAGRATRVWWVCLESGEPYQRAINKQTVPNAQSPYVSGQRILPGFNDLASQHPEVATDWHPTKNGKLTPQDVTCGSPKNVWWLCPVTRRSFTRSVAYAVKSGTLAGHISSGEHQLGEFITSLGVGVVLNDRSIIAPYELDIVIPDMNIAVEFNGVYWHSDAQGKGPDYHYGKWASARDTGYQLITVWEDDWKHRRPVVESMIRNSILPTVLPEDSGGSYQVVELDSEVSSQFLHQHDIHGPFTHGTYHIGLESAPGVLVAVSVCHQNGTDVTMDRFCSSVPLHDDSMKLLLESVECWGRGHSCTTITILADNDTLDGEFYTRMGFLCGAELPPRYQHLHDGVRRPENWFTDQLFREDSHLAHQEGFAVHELITLNNIPKIWDSGRTEYVMPL